MAVSLSLLGGVAAQFFDNNGVILSGGKLYTYAAGTTTPRATYTSSSGATAHANPIVLDSAGRVPGGEIWLTNGLSYKFVIETSTGILLGTYDNIIGGVDASMVSYDPPFTGSVSTNVEAKLAQTVSVKDFGAVGDGVANDTAAIQAAIAGVSAETIINFPQGTYKVTGTLEMPLKVSGNFTVDGNIKWSFKKEILQTGQITVTGTILIDSVWYSKFDHLECVGNFTIYSSNVTWGVFWNNFGMIRCAGTFVIDVDQGQSVNQNNFYNCYCSGGVLIQGAAVSGIREAHNNVWFSLDTTGANLTANDGTTGCHLLNDSNLNQTNTVMNWYAELTGSRLACGNWNILGDNVDANNPAFKADRYNYRLGARAFGRQASYLPIPINNASFGGDWGTLDGDGLPLQLSSTGSSTVTPLSLITPSAENSPDQSIQGLLCTGATAFSSIIIEYKLTTSSRVAGTAYIYQEGNPATTIEVYDGAGVIVSAGAGILTPLGNNWYLLRIGSQGGTIDVAAGELIGTIRIYSALGTPLTASDFRIITSFFVTTEAIAPIPSIKYGQTLAYSTAPPTNGTWKLGDICWNTTPAAGGTPGWVCVTAGVPGTWKAMANVAA
jgi:hypothetical protein